MLKRNLQKFLIFLGIALSGPLSAQSQLKGPSGVENDIKPTDVIIWEAVGAEQSDPKTLTVGFRLRTEQSFAIYKKNTVFKAPPGYEVGEIEGPPTRNIIDPISGENVAVYDTGDFIVHLTSWEPQAAKSLNMEITFLGCTERICLFPFTQSFTIPIDNSSAVMSSNAATAAPAATATEPSSSTPAVESNDLEQVFAQKLAKGELSKWLMLLVLFLGGLATNLTPCVFPMIPITLRILGSQGQRPVLNSVLYALGIVITYSAMGIVVALSGGVFGSIVASTGFNLVFVALFIILGLTMLGFGNFGALQRVGSRLGAGPQNPWNTLLMGAGAGLVAAPCTGPILGAMLAFSASNPNPQATMGNFVVYSVGFALPYVFLGMAAGKVSRLKVSPAIQNAVKLVFAAIMFALAMYYARIPLYNLTKQLKPYWGVLAFAGNAVGIAALIGILRSPTLVTRKSYHILPMFVFAVGLFATTQWLTGAKAPTQAIAIYHSIAEGKAAAQESSKPVIIDGWAEWCEACKKMDASTFVDPDVIAELSEHWIFVKLDLTEINDANTLLTEQYSLQGLPTLVLIPPSGDESKMEKITGYVHAEHLLKALRQFREH